MLIPRNPRVLVVDDSRTIHDDFVKILCPSADRSSSRIAGLSAQLFGEKAPLELPTYELSSAYQGREAVRMVCDAMAADRPYALAFVDMRMPPGWDGVVTIEKLWAIDPRLQIVIC